MKVIADKLVLVPLLVDPDADLNGLDWPLDVAETRRGCIKLATAATILPIYFHGTILRIHWKHLDSYSEAQTLSALLKLLR